MTLPDEEPTYDVVIIGAGPAGIVAAARALHAPNARVLLVDAGPDVEQRIMIRTAQPDDPDVITAGFGGAGLFSDGKLCLSPRIGSTISHRFPPQEVTERQHHIDEMFRGGEVAPLFGADQAAAADLAARAERAGMEYLHYPVRHVGSDQLPRMLLRLRAWIGEQATVRCNTRAVAVTASTRARARWRAELLRDGCGYVVHTNHLVLAPGKVGADWLDQVSTDLGLRREPAQPKLGFRLEGPADFLKPLLQVATDPKLIWRAGGGREVRTHCVCYGGDVAVGEYDGLLLVGGHSESEHRADRSNTAVIATAGKDFPFSAAEARTMVAAINDRFAGVVAQQLGDFLTGEPSTGPVGRLVSGFIPSLPDAGTGDLAALLPVPVVSLLRRFVLMIAELCPQAANPANVIYGPAVERWASRCTVSDRMETGLPGLFVAGDGPGLTGGIIGAADTGWLAGDAIAGDLTAQVATATH